MNHTDVSLDYWADKISWTIKYAFLLVEAVIVCTAVIAWYLIQHDYLSINYAFIILSIVALAVTLAGMLWRPKVIQDLVAYQVEMAATFHPALKDPEEILNAMKLLAEECQVCQTEEGKIAVRRLQQISSMVAEAVALSGELGITLHKIANLMPEGEESVVDNNIGEDLGETA